MHISIHELFIQELKIFIEKEKGKIKEARSRNQEPSHLAALVFDIMCICWRSTLHRI